MTSKKSNVVYNIVIITLLVIIFAILSFNIFGIPQKEYPAVVLGQNLTIQAVNNGSSVATASFSGKCLPGDSIVQNINIKGTDKTIILRVNAYIPTDIGNKINLEIQTLPQWLLHEGYYYYNGLLNPFVNVSLSNKIILPSSDDLILRGEKNYGAIFSVEALIADNQAISVWDLPDSIASLLA